MSEENLLQRKKPEPVPRIQKQIIIPRRAPSTIIPKRKVVYITADKTTCAECPCYPKEEPYQRIKKLNPCRRSPETLYELAAHAVDQLAYPRALLWSEQQVADWVNDLGLPQYQIPPGDLKQQRILRKDTASLCLMVQMFLCGDRLRSDEQYARLPLIIEKAIEKLDCFLVNHIDGLRLMMFENPSRLPEVNIHDFEHILTITQSVRMLYGTDFIRFARSIGLPFRRPLTYCTWFKSRTGPRWGIRPNWKRCDLLRCIKIIKSVPLNLDHWDLVWYQKPDYPRTVFARIPNEGKPFDLPKYNQPMQMCKEYTVPRKFRFQTGLSDSAQNIWMEHRPGSPETSETKEKPKKARKPCVSIDTRLMPKKIDSTGLTGKDLLLARRKMAKPKFFAH